MNTSVVYGMGRCAVCDRVTSSGYLMCPGHWVKVPMRLRIRVNQMLALWHANQCSLGELRAVQDEAIAAVKR